MSVIVFIACLCVAVAVAAVSSTTLPIFYDTAPSKLQATFAEFESAYNKVYASAAERSQRYDIFSQNVRAVNDHNLKYHSYLTYALDITRFADWTEAEFAAFNALQVVDDRELLKSALYAFQDAPQLVGDLPTAIDWSTVSPAVVTPVKNQGNCGSCWAFGATGSWESRYALKYNTLNSLSEQELVDCVLGNDCILGGTSDQAFHYGVQNGGLSLESQYVYTARDGKCQASTHTHYDKLASIALITRNNETAMMVALQTGPITVAVDAQGWNAYRSGVFNGKCGTNLDHNVMMVGYGEENTQKYWKIKNSWGASWGEKGYIRLCRDCGKNGDKGECGVNSTPSFPVVT